MKKLRIFVLSALALFGLASCQPDPETPKPEIKLGQSELVLSAEGETQSVGYLIENAIEGEKIAVDYDADWLTVDTSKVRSISFTAPLNDSGAERSVEVAISYKGAEVMFLTVKQAYRDTPLIIEISDVTATEVVFSVTATDPEMTWIPAVVSKEYADYYTDEQIVEIDIEWLQYTADNQEVSLGILLEQVLAKGSMENIFFDGLEPETDYVLYAYGLSLEAERTTELVKVEFTTEKAWEGDITVAFEVREENHVLHFDATPSHTGVPFYCHYATEEDFERWSQTYGTDDVKELIAKGSIGELLKGLMDIGYFDDASDFYSFFNSTGKIRDNYFSCKASTKYILFAVKWDEQCNLLGEVSTYEYTTQPVEPSNNQITLEVESATQSSVVVNATVTNDDPYVIYPVKSSDLEGKTTEEIFDYMEAHYFLDEFVFSGNKTREYTSLDSDTAYTIVAFGYKAKSMTTAEMTMVEFRTQTSADPSLCTFDFDYQVYEESVWVKVTPSDKGHWYYWGVFDARFTAEDVKTYISDVLIDEWYEGDAAVWASWYLKKGTQAEEVSGLYASTEYRVGVVIMDYYSGEFLSDVVFSETFKTPDPVYADIKLNVAYGNYYDLDELADAGYPEYKQDVSDDSRFAEGGAILPTRMEIEGVYARFFYYIARHDLTDTSIYSDDIFYEDLLENGSSSLETIFPLTYDIYWTIAAMAIDRQGNYTPVYRKKIYLTKDGTSPVSEFVASQKKVAPAKVSAMEWNNYDSRSVGVRTPMRNAEKLIEVVNIEASNLKGCANALKGLRGGR